MRRTIGLAASLATLLPASLAMAQQTPAGQPAQRPARVQVQDQNERQPQGEQRVQRPGGEATSANADRIVSQLATLLALGNKAEIEVSQLAVEKASNDKVRQHAEKMIEEHTAYLQKLQQFKPQMGAANPNRQRLEERGGRQPGAARVPSEGQAQGQAQGQIPGQVEGQAPTQVQGQVQGQNRLMPIMQQAAQRRLEMTKETLSRYEGQDFDMGYLAHQVYAHVEMLSHLEAMQNAGPPEFQQLVSQGAQATAQHLQMAKQLAAQREDKEDGQAGQTSQDRQRGQGAESRPARRAE